jgi:ubiquinone/menaquinone biosynthesis C-methylase UbiE
MKTLDNYWNNKNNVSAFKLKPPSEDLIEFVSKNYPDTSIIDVLDLGCGGGRHTVWLSQNGFRTRACDLHAEMVTATKEAIAAHSLLAEISLASVTSLPYPDESFDLVVSTGVLHNLTNVKDLEIAFNEISRVIKKGGLFFLTIFTNSYISEELKKENEDGLYSTADDIPMLLASAENIKDIANLSNFSEAQEIRKYLTQVETGKRSVYTVVFKNIC